MEITLTGRIKSRVKDFGFIHCEKYNCDYFFHESSFEINSVISIGDLVSFKLKANSGREGSHAIEVKKILEKKNPALVKKPTKKLKYFFDSEIDLLMGFKHIKEKLEIQKSKANSNYEDSEDVIDKIDELLDVVNDILNGPFPNYENVRVEDINYSENKGLNLKRSDINYWRDSFSLHEFASEVEGISEREIDKGRQKDFTIVWHEWKDKERQIFHAGYVKGYFNYSFIEKGSKEQTSVYDTPPPPTKWILNKIKQKGYVFYITSAPVREIAQSSSVPALPPKLGVIETAERILDKNRNNKEWQREIDPQRIRKIQQFIGESNNIIANTPMLFINDDSSITINNNELIIDFSKFLKIQESGEFKGKYIDRKLAPLKDEFGNDVYEDYRPFWIIDGQHRVRGVHLNENEQDLVIPLIIFPKDFSMSQTAKVFAEINTLQKKLNPLHELFMQHRFSIDHPTNIKRKFKDYKITSLENCESLGWTHEDWIHSRANHLAYEVLARLAKNGPLKNRVQFLPQNEDNYIIYVTADQWVNYARTLFERKCYKFIHGDVLDYIYKPTDKETKTDLIDIFYAEMNNYFKAWVEICNHKEWPDKKDRWVDGVRGKALIQRKTHFIILIELYGLVIDLAKTYKKSKDLGGIISVNEFKEILKPFKWVDWTDKDLENTFPGSGEKGRRSLEAWMADAIINGIQYPADLVKNQNIKSQAGKGITSVLDIPNLEIISKNKWPEKNKPVLFKSTRPWNARYECSWKVEDENQDTKTELKVSTSKHLAPMDAEFALKHENYMDDPNFKELSIRVDWKNSHTHTGKKVIKIYK
jgi:DGQHR domain-containing protein